MAISSKAMQMHNEAEGIVPLEAGMPRDVQRWTANNSARQIVWKKAHLHNRNAHEPQKLLALVIVNLRDSDGPFAVLLHICCLPCLQSARKHYRQLFLHQEMQAGRVLHNDGQAQQ